MKTINTNLLMTNRLKKRRKKYYTIFLDTEPKSKKATKNKSELQKKIIDQMRNRNWRCIKSKVAIEIVAYTKQKNPPQIQTFVKNILDIMYKKELLQNNKDNIYLPFEDDKLIKYIRSEYKFLNTKPKIYIKVRPLKSFISDIHFVNTELESKYQEELNTKNQTIEYRGLIDDEEGFRKFLTKEAYESLIKMNKLDTQKNLSERISITPNIISLIYPKNNKIPKNIKKIYRDWSAMLLDMPNRIHLPGIPLKENGEKAYKKKYKEELKKRMRKYLENNPIFNNLQSPIIITAFYMPPKIKKKNYKDLDNIMLEYIMPTMNEIFQPPISLFNLVSEEINNKKINNHLFSVPKSLEGSAIGYEIIELPYNFSKSDTCSIIIGFKIETTRKSLMSLTDEKIDKYIKENQYI